MGVDGDTCFSIIFAENITFLSVFPVSDIITLNYSGKTSYVLLVFIFLFVCLCAT